MRKYYGYISCNRPPEIKSRKHGNILTMDLSDTGSAGIFSRWTNQNNNQYLCIYTHFIHWLRVHCGSLMSFDKHSYLVYDGAARGAFVWGPNPHLLRAHPAHAAVAAL
eukprot:4546087-Pyramimonas_sp.AAC.1